MTAAQFPRIDPLGIDGVVVRFADALSDRANRAALAFRGAVAGRRLPGVAESASSLVSVYLRLAPDAARAATLEEVERLLAGRDWFAAPLPRERRLWRVPALYGGEHGPQLARAAEAAGMSVAEAVAALSSARLRVMAIGFAPGQPYLGHLPERWDLPRQQDLSTRVPQGALAVAVRQMVLFTSETPTGWYHVARTSFRCFRPDGTVVFPLQPGDEMEFPSVAPEAFEALADDPAGDGGASCENLP